jgi:hypothetical protein
LKEKQDFENTIDHGLKMFDEMEIHFNEFMKIKSFVQNCTCGEIQLNEKIDMFDEMDYHYSEFMKTNAFCTIIQNYVKNFKTIYCLWL